MTLSPIVGPSRGPHTGIEHCPFPSHYPGFLQLSEMQAKKRPEAPASTDSGPDPTAPREAVSRADGGLREGLRPGPEPDQGAGPGGDDFDLGQGVACVTGLILYRDEAH
jgi:hypothetical protein